jgi:hypothetical protein
MRTPHGPNCLDAASRKSGTDQVVFASHFQILEFSAGKICQSIMELYPVRLICINTTNILKKPCFMGGEWRHGGMAAWRHGGTAKFGWTTGVLVPAATLHRFRSILPHRIVL